MGERIQVLINMIEQDTEEKITRAQILDFLRTLKVESDELDNLNGDNYLFD